MGRIWVLILMQAPLSYVSLLCDTEASETKHESSVLQLTWFYLLLCSFGLSQYVSYLIIGAFWRETAKEMVVLGFPLTNEPIS